jgi:GTP-sensing pleiotropic transcriptional regulator CodY
MLPTISGGTSGAVGSLGLDLSQQVKAETDEERKKRMALQQQQQSLGPAGSMAVTSIFGPMGGNGA